MTLCTPPTTAAIRQAVTALAEGRLVAFPTETVYGLGADACNDQAVAAIFKAKGRPRFNPLIVHVSEHQPLEELVVLDPLSEALVQHFWPGPLTLVLKRRKGTAVSLLASAGLDTLALRCPAHPVAQALLKASGLCLAAPSANPSGAISPTTAAHVAEGLGEQVAMILDGGRCTLGLESTIVQISEGKAFLLRPGAVPREAIEAVLGQNLRPPPARATPSAPGQLSRHYAPRHALRLNAGDAAPDEALLAFGAPVPGTPVACLNLSPEGDLTEAAANLFAHLRALDAMDCRAIAVMPIPDIGLGEAINDRLRRAAAPA